MMTDPIADMLTRVRNAAAVGHKTVVLPSSRMKESLAEILVSEGYIDRYEVKEAGAGKQLTLVMRYGDRRNPAITGVTRVSKPGHRIYRGASEIPRVQGGLGVAVVSTSQGLLPDREARRRRLGGEIVCEVW
ncbi:MAG: 30S ribosomal protein S8 [Acidimicrobiia bacterium]|jgi:small subunit ribosomal protein S8|nr:30S ribosomal protein S8 [Acidimicrobiia bacterium]